MAWSIFALLVFSVLWLGVSVLLSVVSWRTYADQKRPWTSQTCNFISAQPFACENRAPFYSLNVTIRLEGVRQQDLTYNSCGYPNNETAAAAAAAVSDMDVVDGMIPCFLSPDEDELSLTDRTISLSYKMRLLLGIIVPVLASITGAIMICLLLYRFVGDPGRSSHQGRFVTFDLGPQRHDVAYMSDSAATQGSETVHGRASRRLTVAEADLAVEKFGVMARARIPSPSGDGLLMDDVCVICLDDLAAEPPGTRESDGMAEDVDAEKQTPDAVLLPCRHVYHPKCIRGWWVKGHAVCPCCNLNVASLVRQGDASGDADAASSEAVAVDSAVPLGGDSSISLSDSSTPLSVSIVGQPAV